MCLVLCHDWDKWKVYTSKVKQWSPALGETEKSVGWGKEVRQRRRCKKCGKVQDRKVR